VASSGNIWGQIREFVYHDLSGAWTESEVVLLLFLCTDTYRSFFFLAFDGCSLLLVVLVIWKPDLYVCIPHKRIII
jgi:hypothetical protein